MCYAIVWQLKLTVGHSTHSVALAHNRMHAIMPLKLGRVGWHALFVPLRSDFAAYEKEQLPDCRLLQYAAAHAS